MVVYDDFNYAIMWQTPIGTTCLTGSTSQPTTPTTQPTTTPSTQPPTPKRVILPGIKTPHITFLPISYGSMPSTAWDRKWESEIYSYLYWSSGSLWMWWRLHDEG